MFKSLRSVEQTKLNHSGRSYIGETMQLEGDLRTSGSIDVAGLINGNIFVSEMTVAETGSIRGSIEATAVEINGHIAGKISADTVIVGKTAVVKGDIFFKNTLKTEEGADIDGYIKRVSNGKLNTEEDIANIKIDKQIFDQINLDPGGVIVTAKGENCDFVSRFFTPQASILEDPVTGSAHCSLIPFWSLRLSKNELNAIQISNRGGKLHCENKKNRIIISGKAKTYSIGNLWTE